MRSSITILGAEGNIGAGLSRALLAQGRDVFQTSRKPDSGLQPGWGYWDAEQPETDEELPHSDLMICAFGIGSLQQCEKDPDAAASVNVNAPARLAERFGPCGTRVVLLSTNLVFGGEQALPDERVTPEPRCAYARQKRAAEEAVLAHGGDVIRLTKQVESLESLFSNWVQQLRKDQPVEAFSDRRVSLIAGRQIQRSVEALLGDPFQGVLHLSGAEDLTYCDWALWLAQTLGKPASLVGEVRAADKLEPLAPGFEWDRHESLSMRHTTKRFGIEPLPTAEAQSIIQDWLRESSWN